MADDEASASHPVTRSSGANHCITVNSVMQITARCRRGGRAR